MVFECEEIFARSLPEQQCCCNSYSVPWDDVSNQRRSGVVGRLEIGHDVDVLSQRGVIADYVEHPLSRVPDIGLSVVKLGICQVGSGPSFDGQLKESPSHDITHSI